MFLLTEGTLFFLDLALSTRSRDQKPSLRSVVQEWVDGVAAATSDSANVPQTTAGASSTLYPPPPVYLSPTFGLASSTGGACKIAGDSDAQNVLAPSKTSFPAYDKDSGEIASHYDENSMATSESDMMSSAIDSNSDCCSQALSQRQQVPRAGKRKIDDTDIVFYVEPDRNGDEDIELGEPVPEDARQVEKMSSVGVSIKSLVLPPKKKVKHQDASVLFPSSPLHHSLGYISATCTALPQPLQRLRIDKESYLIEVIKKRSEYTTKDLPVPCDRRWSHDFISTAILWYSVQKNIWNVAKEELSSALQRIFDVIYPGIKYRVTPAGSVFVLTLQRINEWQSSFGSSALAMMLHFFSSLDDDDHRVRSAAEFLATDFRFLRADPDSSEPTEMFRSPFLLILLAITHLGDIAAFVDVPGWDMRAMAAGKGAEGVVAIASAALERAMTFFCDGALDVDLLAETARFTDAPTTIGTFPKAVLDTLARRDAPPALRFSSANWSSHTAAYREAVRKRGTDFVCGTFAAAQAKRRKLAGDDDVEVGAAVSASGVPDPRAFL